MCTCWLWRNDVACLFLKKKSHRFMGYNAIEPNSNIWLPMKSQCVCTSEQTQKGEGNENMCLCFLLIFYKASIKKMSLSNHQEMVKWVSE